MAKSIRTFWNQPATPKRFQDRRVLVYGHHWVKTDPKAASVLSWLRKDQNEVNHAR